MAWRGEYLGALRARDALEQANKEVYNLYSSLADRSAETQAQVPASGTATGGAPNATQLQTDLIEAQRARGDLTKKLAEVSDELQQLRVRSKDDGKRISILTADKSILSTKLKNKDEELIGKKKLLDDLHDETVALTLQLNVAIEKAQNLKNENQELVDRWMARMGQEAEAMNTASKFS